VESGEWKVESSEWRVPSTEWKVYVEKEIDIIDKIKNYK